MNQFGQSLAAVSVLLLTPLMANADTVTAGDMTGGTFNDGYATGIRYDNTAARGTSDNRNDANNALGNTGAFFEIGLESTVDFVFGTQFGGATVVMEVTGGGSASAWPESVNVYVSDGMTTNLSDFSNFTFIASKSNTDSGTVSFDVGAGPWTTLRLVDTSSPTPPSAKTGGFDVQSVQVTPVPLPAAAWLFGSALVGAGVIGRRKKKANAAA